MHLLGPWPKWEKGSVMTETLQERANGQCELCAATDPLTGFAVSPQTDIAPDTALMACETCLAQLRGDAPLDPEHWRALEGTMWSPAPPVQVMAYRLLTVLARLDWAGALRDQLWLEEDVRLWAETRSPKAEVTPTHFDSNGAGLAEGDTVTLTKDLTVKGSSQIAKRGTAVRGISLVADNPGQIEGRVNGERIVILTKFTKKQS